MKILYSSLIALCLSLSANAQSTFVITYDGFTPEAQTAFQYAANIWANTLDSPIPIKVIAHFQPLGPGLLGIAFPNGRVNFPGAPFPDTWYVTSLANALAGKELNPGETDIELYLNSSQSWYFDTTGVGTCTQHDFVTVALHEICHGLGMLSVAKKSGTMGSFGLVLASDFFPLTTSFPWPDLDTMPAVYDRLLVSELNEPLYVLPNPSNSLGSFLSSNSIYIKGPATLAANNGIPPKIYAPGTYALGSSITHLDEATYPVGNINELMTPQGSTCHSLHHPGPIVLGILQDIGWRLPTTSIHDDLTTKFQFKVSPNPFTEEISISHLSPNPNRKIDMTMCDITGKIVYNQKQVFSDTQISTAYLAEGFYTLQIFDGQNIETFKLIKQ